MSKIDNNTFDLTTIIGTKSKKIRRDVAKTRVQLKKTIGYIQQQPIEEITNHIFIQQDCMSNAEDLEEKSERTRKKFAKREDI